MRRKPYIKTTLMAMAAMLTVACSDSYPGLVYVPEYSITNEEGYGDNIPVMVFLNEQDFFSFTTEKTSASSSEAKQTRGTGAIENDPDDLHRKNMKIHVFAFRDGSTANLTKSAYSDRADDTEKSSCLLDGKNYYYGMTYKLAEDNSGAIESTLQLDADHDSVPCYGRSKDIGYNFFAYHIDDFEPTSANTHREQDHITYDLEIDGSQDIMLGSAPTPITETMIDTSYAKLNLTATERKTIEEIGGYSAYAAQRNLHPVVRMKHKLARFVFRAYPMTDGANDVAITGLEVQSMYSGQMVVASQTTSGCSLTFDTTRKKYLEMRGYMEEGMTECPKIDTIRVAYTEDMEDIDWSDRPSEQVGSSLLLVPDNEYLVKIKYRIKEPSTYYDDTKEAKEEYSDAEYTSKITASDIVDSKYLEYDSERGVWTFKPSLQYNVKIGVSGPRQIQIMAVAPSWGSGGSINVETD